MEEPRLSDYLNDKNKALFEELSKEFQISLEFSDEEYYSVYTQGHKATIYVSNWPCKASFTHELLHILLVKRNYSITHDFKIAILSSDILYNTYPVLLADHGGNALEHAKFLPIYLQMGFRRKDFLYQFDSPVCLLKDIAWIELCFNNVILWKTGAEHFIGNFFAVRSNVNPKINYDDCLAFLKRVDGELYNILDDFYNEWLELDIESTKTYFYVAVRVKFFKDLEDWTQKKTLQIAV